MPLKVIVHNDDLGHNLAFNKAIATCYKNGITTSASLTTNGTAYKEAKNLLGRELKGAGLGLHLNITDGAPYSKKFQNYFVELAFGNKKLLSEIEDNLADQFERTISKDHLPIDHVNGHDHTFMIPPIFKIVCKLAQKYDIEYLRFSKERYHFIGNPKDDLYPFTSQNFLKFALLNTLAKINQKTLTNYKLKTSNSLYGILHTDHMNEKVIIGALKHALKMKFKLIDIVTHPAITTPGTKYTSQFFVYYTNKPSRKIEYQALQSPKLKKFIEDHKIILTNYRSL